MIQLLKKSDRILLEMYTGILFVGIVCQLVGVFFVQNQARYASSLWFGILFSLIATTHMGRTLSRALIDSENASKIIVRGYTVRYVMIIFVMIVIGVTDVMNPLIVFMAYMSLKVTAYLQPITHKLYNKLFHETDPIPQPLPEEENCEEGNVSQKGEILSE